MKQKEILMFKGDLEGDEGKRAIHDEFEKQGQHSFEELMVDLSEVEAIDFDCLLELMTVRSHYALNGFPITFCNTPPHIENILDAFRTSLS